MNLRQQLVKQQLLKPIMWCELKGTFCAYSTAEMCLTIKECPLRFEVRVEGTFRRKR